MKEIKWILNWNCSHNCYNNDNNYNCVEDVTVVLY